MAPLLLTCHFWTKYIEPFFDRIIVKMEKFMVREDAEPERNQSQRRGYLSRLRAILRGVALVIRHGGITHETTTPESFDLEDCETGALLHEMQERSPVSLEPEEDALLNGFEATPLDGYHVVPPDPLRRTR